MLGIALQYGITLESLQAANPGVDPQFLSVGTGLIIPLGDEIQVVAVMPTAVAVEWMEPVCYQSGEGGAWCFLLVENNRPVTVENLSAWIGVFGLDGATIATQVAVGPLNILRPGQAMPLMVYFPPPLPYDFVVRGELLTAIELSRDDTRYLDLGISNLNQEVKGEGGSEARVSGAIELPAGSPVPGQIWIAVVAYDQDGRVVGLRKWESVQETAFDLTVYSLGGAIDRVEVLTEIRP